MAILKVDQGYPKVTRMTEHEYVATVRVITSLSDGSVTNLQGLLGNAGLIPEIGSDWGTVRFNSTEELYARGVKWTDEVNGVGTNFGTLPKLLRIENVAGDQTDKLLHADLIYGIHETESYVEDGGLQKPLESKADYRANWNYHLAATTAATAVPAWWDTSAEVKIAAADAASYRWIREPAELPTNTDGTNWALIKNKTKQGVDQFVCPSPVVTERYFFPTIASMRQLSTFAPGLQATPTVVPPTFSDWEWLVMSVRESYDGFFYVMEVRFQGAESWDSDLYPTE